MTSHVRGEVIGQPVPVVTAEPAFVELQVAPFRRAFLVRRGDKRQLLEALFGAAAIWGGTRCPVLPVEPDGQVREEWMRVAEAVDPAELIDFTVTNGGESAWVGARESRWPVTPARPLGDRSQWSPHPIAAIQPEELKNLTLYLPGERTLFDAASAGCVGPPYEDDWWRQVTRDVREADSPQELASAQLGDRTVLSAAMLHDDDKDAVMVWNNMVLLWVTSDPDDPDEITRWWNTRALRPRLRLSAISILITPDVAGDRSFAEELQQVSRRRVFTRPDLVVTSGSVPDERLHDIASRLGFEHDPGGEVRQPLLPLGPPDLDRQLTYMISHDLLDWWGGARTSGAVSVAAISVQRPTTRIRETSPLRWNPAVLSAGRVSLRVSGPPFKGPRLAPVARLYHKRARWHRGRVEMPETIAPVFDFEIRIPGPAEILKAACSARNVTYTLSDKARHVQGVWALARDPAMFRRPVIIDVIRVLTPESSRDLINRLNRRPDLTEPEKHELRTLAAANRVTMRTLKDIASLLDPSLRSAVAAALQELVTTGMVVRGLRADCQVCLVQHLYGLDEARPVPACPGCGADAVYAVDSGTGEPALYYRINTLVQTLSLNGGLAPLAATALLASENAYVVPGAQISRGGNDAGEVDLLGWQGETLFVGEAKMSATQFAASDHDKDVSKSVLVGADKHLAVCLDEIPPETRAAIQSACDRAHISLDVLDTARLLTA